jgi:hypothetical protein
MTSDLTEFFDEDMHEIEHQVDESEIEYGVNGSELEYERKSVAEMRGICSFDYNGNTVFAKANVEDVSRAISERYSTSQWQKNIINREIELTNQCFFIFQYSGHVWTNIISRQYSNYDYAQFISKSLKTRTIDYEVSDTASALKYRIFENGELLERLNTGECYENIEWESTIHHVGAEQIGNIEEWVEKIFIENDALEPSIEFMNLVGYWMHKPGDKITMYYTGGNIERCDFITL